MRGDGRIYGQNIRLNIIEVPTEGTHELRRRVLRDGDPDVDVTFPEDTAAGAFHLAAVDEDERVVGVATFFPSPTPYRPGAKTYQLRGMAVDDGLQGSGVGRTLLEAAAERLRTVGVDAAWANARDTALGFYERLGWKVAGDGFRYGWRSMPHHVVVLDL